MKRTLILPAAALILAAAPFTADAQSGQTTVNRIEKMPRIPAPYLMRDWKDVTRGYIDLTLNPQEGEHMPLSTIGNGGNNYPEYQPLRMDTYVGWNAHASGAEAVNVMPAVVSAYITGNEHRSPYRLAEGVLDFFNKKNKQNVYLNGNTASSGGDWWYDAMPNVYFLQLAALTDDLPADLVREQTDALASQWLKCVCALGGNSYQWTRPYMNYRAFNLYSMKPLTKGVREPESAGSVAWILYHAYLRTHNEDYRRGAELALEYLNSETQNPAYELQLAYGVQAMALMNAQRGTNFDTERFFTYCFDRGWLRGWGSIVGNWGGYDMSGLIGEANDGGNDYAFVMNGFQQVGALAPAVKYDKRLARAYARWVLNVANASRYFYPGFLPDDNCEQTSLAWSRTYDKESVIPYESIKENYNGHSPLAMGDALKGKWATTNLSLYSGSSVGLMAAVVSTTDVDAILDLNLNATDFTASHPKNLPTSQPGNFPTHLFYNPYDEPRAVTVNLPEGEWRIYDALTETWLGETSQSSSSLPSSSPAGAEFVAVSSFSLALPADEARMLVYVPADAVITTRGRQLFADGKCIDWHLGYDFNHSLRVKNLELQNYRVNRGDAITARVTIDGPKPTDGAKYEWKFDDQPVIDCHGQQFYKPSYNVEGGNHTITVTATVDGESVSESIVLYVYDPQNPVPDGIDAPATSQPSDLPTSLYDLSGRRLAANTQRGIVIENAKKVIRK